MTSEDDYGSAQGSDELEVSAKVGAGVAPRYEGASHYGNVPSALGCHSRLFNDAKDSSLVDDRGDVNSSLPVSWSAISSEPGSARATSAWPTGFHDREANEA